MASRTPRFGLNRFGNGADGSLGDDGGKFSGTDRQIIDKLLAALETHVHAGGERLADPTDAPGLTLDGTGGSLEGGTTYYYTVTYVDQFGLETAYGDEASVATPATVARPGNPGLSAVSGGSLDPGLYQYALTAHKSTGETTLSGVTTITVSDFQTVEVSFVAPAGADDISIWRQGPTESDFTRIDTVGIGTSPYTDDGTIPADPCACDPENLPPVVNTTGATARVTITAPTGDLAQPTLAERWRIYRTTSSGAYGAASLLADIADTTVEGGNQLVESYLDDGTVALQPGQPPLTSRTLLPSQSTSGGGGLGGMFLLRSADDTIWQIHAGRDAEIITTAVDFGVPGVESFFADAGVSLIASDASEWHLTVGNDGVLTTTEEAAGEGESSFTYGQGPDLPTVDGSVYFRLGVDTDGSLITYGDREPAVIEGINVKRIIASDTEPGDLQEGDVWLDTSGS